MKPGWVCCGQTCGSPAAQTAQMPQPATKGMVTRSPTRQRVTPGAGTSRTWGSTPTSSKTTAHGVRAGPVGHRRRTQALTPNTQASSVIETSVTSTMPMRFSHSPPLTMSPMRTYPEP